MLNDNLAIAIAQSLFKYCSGNYVSEYVENLQKGSLIEIGNLFFESTQNVDAEIEISDNLADDFQTNVIEPTKASQYSKIQPSLTNITEETYSLALGALIGKGRGLFDFERTLRQVLQENESKSTEALNSVGLERRDPESAKPNENAISFLLKLYQHFKLFLPDLGVQNPNFLGISFVFSAALKELNNDSWYKKLTDLNNDLEQNDSTPQEELHGRISQQIFHLYQQLLAEVKEKYMADKERNRSNDTATANPNSELQRGFFRSEEGQHEPSTRQRRRPRKLKPGFFAPPSLVQILQSKIQNYQKKLDQNADEHVNIEKETHAIWQEIQHASTKLSCDKKKEFEDTIFKTLQKLGSTESNLRLLTQLKQKRNENTIDRITKYKEAYTRLMETIKPLNPTQKTDLVTPLNQLLNETQLFSNTHNSAICFMIGLKIRTYLLTEGLYEDKNKTIFQDFDKDFDKIDEFVLKDERLDPNDRDEITKDQIEITVQLNDKFPNLEQMLLLSSYKQPMNSP